MLVEHSGDRCCHFFCAYDIAAQRPKDESDRYPVRMVTDYCFNRLIIVGVEGGIVEFMLREVG
jgi:hypothetical protein